MMNFSVCIKVFAKLLINLCCIFLLLVNTTANADNYLLHQGGPASDEAVAMIPGHDLGAIIIGSTENTPSTGRDGLVMKAGPSWYNSHTRSYGGSGTDELYSASPTHGTGTIICGRTNSFGSTNDAAFIMELNTNQGLVSAFSIASTHHLWGTDVFETSDLNYLLFANLLDPNQERLIMTKFDGMGNAIWTTRLADPMLRDYSFLSSAPTSDNGFVICAHMDMSILLVAKLDENGSIQWHQHLSLNTGNITVADITEFSDGSFYIAGSMLTPTLEGYLAKLSSSGNLEWINAIEHAQHAVYLNRLESIYSDRIMVVGTVFSSLDDSAEILYARFDLNGNLVWTQSAGVYNSASEDFGTDIIRSNDGALYICGWGNYEPPSITDMDLIVIRSGISTGEVGFCDLVTPVNLIQNDIISQISVSQETITQTTAALTFTDVTSQVVVGQPYSIPPTVCCWEEIRVPSMNYLGVLSILFLIGGVIVKSTSRS